MAVIPLIIYAAQLAVACIILFYVIEMITMPTNMKRICQALIVLIAVLSVLGALIGPGPSMARVGPLNPMTPATPSIIR